MYEYVLQVFSHLPPPTPKTLSSTFVYYYTLACCLIKKCNPMISSLLSVCSQSIFNSVSSHCVHLNLKSDHVYLLLRSLHRLPVDLRLKSKTLIMAYKTFWLTLISFFPPLSEYFSSLCTRQSESCLYYLIKCVLSNLMDFSQAAPSGQDTMHFL